jgi:hypothetical protein
LRLDCLSITLRRLSIIGDFLNWSFHPIKVSFPCTYLDLSSGFRYLGYNLKLGASTATDWTWLVSSFERKIGLWYFKWLSLGGRLILINSVLQSLAVYWMLLEKIPAKILTLLRKLSFNFLWNDFAGNRHFHLCKWQILSRPKREGGWGLKNLFTFNKALLACSFWRALTSNFLLASGYLGKISWIQTALSLDSPNTLFTEPGLPDLEGTGIFFTGHPALAPLVSGLGC